MYQIFHIYQINILYTKHFEKNIYIPVGNSGRRPNVCSIDSECKTKNWCIASQAYFKYLKNSSFFSWISLFLANFSWKFVACFLAGSSSFAWHELASLGDNHLATLLEKSLTIAWDTSELSVFPDFLLGTCINFFSI